MDLLLWRIDRNLWNLCKPSHPFEKLLISVMFRFAQCKALGLRRQRMEFVFHAIAAPPHSWN